MNKFVVLLVIFLVLVVVMLVVVTSKPGSAWEEGRPHWHQWRLQKPEYDWRFPFSVWNSPILAIGGAGSRGNCSAYPWYTNPIPSKMNPSKTFHLVIMVHPTQSIHLKGSYKSDPNLRIHKFGPLCSSQSWWLLNVLIQNFNRKSQSLLGKV